MYAWCVVCEKVRLFYYKWKEAHYCCEECQHCEKFPDYKPPTK